MNGLVSSAEEASTEWLAMALLGTRRTAKVFCDQGIPINMALHTITFCVLFYPSEASENKNRIYYEDSKLQYSGNLMSFIHKTSKPEFKKRVL